MHFGGKKQSHAYVKASVGMKSWLSVVNAFTGYKWFVFLVPGLLAVRDRVIGERTHVGIYSMRKELMSHITNHELHRRGARNCEN